MDSISVPTTVYLTQHNTLREMIDYMNDYLSLYLNIIVDDAYCTFKLKNPDYFLILGEGLRFRTQVQQSVITPWDKSPTSAFPVNLSASIPTNPYVVIVPKCYPHETHVIREKYKLCSRKAVLSTLSKYMDVYYEHNTLTLLPVDPTKLYVFSEPLHLYLPSRQAGLYISPTRLNWTGMYHIDFKESWQLYVYDMTYMYVYPPVPKTHLRG